MSRAIEGIIINNKPEQTGVGTAAVRVNDVCKSFGSRVVLEEINFHLLAGEGLCICGANAAGKSTLLRIAAGLLEASGGTVEICGLNIRREREKTKSMIGVVLHSSMVYPELTVLENLRFFARLYGIKDSKGRIEELLEETGLGSCKGDIGGVLSRGMTQRLAVARALLHKPKVLLADEAFSGLDREASGRLVTTLNNFKESGGAILMTAHNVSLPGQCCERVAVLDNHKLIFEPEVLQINYPEENY